jgi:hypothetical protein
VTRLYGHHRHQLHVDSRQKASTLRFCQLD